ncbi:MAG: TVP38/TMEM64 family protein [Clostridia bacterium]|nr:TVP38/TMEM64 family protein [Clostridia bacterium]
MNKYIKIISLILMILFGVLLVHNIGLNHISPERIKAFILSFGWIAPIVYILLYTLRPITLFPASILSLGGGLAFGALFGTVYTVVGASLGAILAFLTARKLGSEAVEQLLGNKLTKLDNKIEAQGFYAVLIMRLIPIFPFDAVSYWSGLSKVHFKHFVLATVIGIIPGTFVYNFMGDSLQNPQSFQFLLAVILMAILIIIPLLYKKIKGKEV